jgi:hypothetical protein
MATPKLITKKKEKEPKVVGRPIRIDIKGDVY